MTDAARYGDDFADVYDRWYGSDPDTEAAVARLVELAAGGPILELGAGTGRLAIPLAERRLAVVAVDVSPAMLERLAARAGPVRVDRVEADMADLDGADDRRLDGPFSVVVIANNTLFNLPDAEAGRRCVAHATSRLAADGVLVVEADVADPTAPAAGREVRRRADGTEVVLSWDHDSARHVVSGRTLDGRGRVRHWELCYASPAEIDRWAAAAGLRLLERGADWSGTPADGDFGHHVSVYGR